MCLVRTDREVARQAGAEVRLDERQGRDRRNYPTVNKIADSGELGSGDLQADHVESGLNKHLTDAVKNRVK